MDNIYIVTLYDYYGELLTDKQRKYFEDYYFLNLSLQEIADDFKVSRNAVSKTILGINNKLSYYESKLKLYENGQKISKLLEKIKDEKIKKEIEDLI